MNSEDVRRVNRAINKMAKLYREAKSRKLAALDLHSGQDVLLWMVGQAENGLTVSELASQLGVESPTVTRSLTRMEGSGLFTRQSNPKDRRQVRIVLTRKGSGMISEVERIWEALAADTLGPLPASQRETVLKALEAANERLRKQVDPDILAEG